MNSLNEMKHLRNLVVALNRATSFKDLTMTEASDLSEARQWCVDRYNQLDEAEKKKKLLEATKKAVIKPVAEEKKSGPKHKRRQKRRS